MYGFDFYDVFRSAKKGNEVFKRGVLHKLVNKLIV